MRRVLRHIAFFSLAMLTTGAVAEDELPKELLLRCELKDTTFTVTGGKTDHDVTTEIKNFRLKDGTFEFTSGYVPLGTDCKLFNGKIACKYSKTTASRSAQFGPSVSKRESVVILTRATGEMQLHIKNVLYTGETIKGEPSMTMDSHYEGNCRSIGKPLF